MLFKDRNLNIAILISVSCHLIFILLIRPTFASVELKKNPVAISFLGSILEEIVAVPDRTFNPEKLSFMQKVQRDSVSLKRFTLTPPGIIAQRMNLQGEKGNYPIPRNKYEIASLIQKYKARESNKIKFKDFIITGEARNRIVLYRPKLPVISIFPPHFSLHYIIAVRFRISAQGFVERPECIISSGSPEIDTIALSYIRRWQFVPSYDEDRGNSQEGVVRIRFNAS